MSTDNTARWWPGHDPSSSGRRVAERVSWLFAIAFYAVGDVVSTVLGLWAGATEGNPVPAAVIDALPGLFSVAVVMTLWKAFVVLALVRLARRLPSRYRFVVPAAVALLGIVVVAWNATVLFTLYS